jgi:hypothetical protein
MLTVTAHSLQSRCHQPPPAASHAHPLLLDASSLHRCWRLVQSSKARSVADGRRLLGFFGLWFILIHIKLESIRNLKEKFRIASTRTCDSGASVWTLALVVPVYAFAHMPPAASRGGPHCSISRAFAKGEGQIDVLNTTLLIKIS